MGVLRLTNNSIECTKEIKKVFRAEQILLENFQLKLANTCMMTGSKRQQAFFRFDLASSSLNSNDHVRVQYVALKITYIKVLGLDRLNTISLLRSYK
jgi:hypothetical protein